MALTLTPWSAVVRAGCGVCAGVFSRDEGTGRTEVWAPAEAVRIVPV